MSLSCTRRVSTLHMQTWRKGDGLRVALPVQRRPVWCAPDQGAQVDEIERVFGIGPLAAEIVDLEADVGRHVFDLCGREVGS